tara:strand:+ start:208 stop:411 length:204 start_codon:yes stop_codon:yes gene_type:complete
MNVFGWLITGVVFCGLLIPAGYVKLCWWWTDREVAQVKEDIRDMEGEKIELLKLMIEEYETQKEKKV